MSINCYADTETRSELNLTRVGTAAYAEHPSTRIQLFAYSFGESDTADIWDRESGEPMPKDLQDAFRDPEVIFTYHNAAFDRTLIEQTLKIKLPIQRYRCSMAQALSHALPGSLDKLGEVLGLPEDQKKLKDGRRLVLKFCQPRKQKDGSLKWCTPETDPEDWAKYKEYCRTDVLAMKAIIKRMPKWNYPQQGELELWYMDQELNDHGMFIDTELVDSAIRAVTIEQASLAGKTKTMTRDAVNTATQRDALMSFIESEYGEAPENMRKATVEALIDDPETPEPLRQLLQVRLDTSTSSTAKHKKIFQAVSKDGYLRGGIQYCGASRTGRDGSKVYNCLNLPKPSLPVLYNPQGLDKHIVQHQNILSGIEALKGDYAELIGLDIMPLCSSVLRYLITAPKGKKLVVADLKAIEARVTPYIAEEEWKVQFFRDFDAGKIKYDNYVAAYAKSFNISPEQVTKEQRQIGKIQELALGFGGAAGSLVSFCEMYNIDIPEMAKSIQRNVPTKVADEAISFFDWMIEQEINEAKETAKKEQVAWDGTYEHTRTYGLDKEVFAALDSVKRLWRMGHPKTAQCWKDADAAMRMAIDMPNKYFTFGKCRLIRKGKWVRIILPSGRSLCYPGAKINKKGDIVFMGVHQKTKQWCEIRTTGAKIFQNSVQATARDFFKYGQMKARDAGYQPILVVYDELVTEVPDTDEYTAHGLEQLMSMNPPWGEDLPIAADGFEDYRYHKSLD
jgi:DNA polymerase